MDDPATDLELPRAIALAWGVAANPQRGPKRELSIEQIVETAVDLADAGGLAAVSMSSVASALGYTPMSLYRYLSAKDDLVLLMQEHAIGLPPEAVREATEWRNGLEEWAAAQLRIYRDHSWVLDIPIRGMPVTPNNLAWLDAALTALEHTPLEADEKVSVALAVQAQTRWQANIERGYREAAEAAGSDTDQLDRASVALLEALVTETDFPAVAQALHAGAFSPQPSIVADPFRFGLDRVLDGVVRYLADLDSARSIETAQPPAEVEAVLQDKTVRDAGKRVREAEKSLREARKREREAIKNARARHS